MPTSLADDNSTGHRVDVGLIRNTIPIGLLFIWISTTLLGAIEIVDGGIIAEINAVRANHRVRPLRMEEAAMRTARIHAEELAERRILSHHSLDGRRVTERYRDQGGTGLTAGENLGAGDSVAAVIRGWMGSESHRRNMLNPRWSALGVGFYPLEDGRFVVAAVFTGSHWSGTNVAFFDADDERTAKLTGTFHANQEAADPVDLGLRVLGERFTPSYFQPAGNGEYRTVFDIPIPLTADPDYPIPAELVVRTGSRWRATDLFLLSWNSMISAEL